MVLLVLEALAVVMGMVLLTGCSTQRVMEPTIVERVKTDTLRQVVHQRDSVYLRDSIYVENKGDTVMMERWHTAYRDRWRTDTIYQSRTDSVPVPYPVIQEVEAKLTWWQQTRIHIANVMLMIIGGLAAVWVVRRYLRR